MPVPLVMGFMGSLIDFLHSWIYHIGLLTYCGYVTDDAGNWWQWAHAEETVDGSRSTTCRAVI